jgi:hypothetical protein
VRGQHGAAVARGPDARLVRVRQVEHKRVTGPGTRTCSVPNSTEGAEKTSRARLAEVEAALRAGLLSSASQAARGALRPEGASGRATGLLLLMARRRRQRSRRAERVRCRRRRGGDGNPGRAGSGWRVAPLHGGWMRVWQLRRWRRQRVRLPNGAAPPRPSSHGDLGHSQPPLAPFPFPQLSRQRRGLNPATALRGASAAGPGSQQCSGGGARSRAARQRGAAGGAQLCGGSRRRRHRHHRFGVFVGTRE